LEGYDIEPLSLCSTRKDLICEMIQTTDYVQTSRWLQKYNMHVFGYLYTYLYSYAFLYVATMIFVEHWFQPCSKWFDILQTTCIHLQIPSLKWFQISFDDYIDICAFFKKRYVENFVIVKLFYFMFFG